MNAAVIIYGLCLAASATCAGLLARAWRRARTPLLLWTALAFGFFTLNNLVLVLDMIVLPQADLWIWRQASAMAGLGVLLYGFVWDTR